MTWVQDQFLQGPNAFGGGARVTELKGSGAPIEQPFKSVLPYPGVWHWVLNLNLGNCINMKKLVCLHIKNKSNLTKVSTEYHNKLNV